MNLFARTKNTLKSYVATQTGHAFEVHSGFRVQSVSDSTDTIRWNPGGRVRNYFEADAKQVLVLVQAIVEIENAGSDTTVLWRAYNKMADRLNTVYKTRFYAYKIGGVPQLGFQG